MERREPISKELFFIKEPMEQKKNVLYLCDRRACNPCHNEYCRHTNDITHAVNFGMLCPGTYVEKEDTDE